MYLERAGLGQLPSVFICSPYFIPYRFISQKLKGVMGRIKETSIGLHQLGFRCWYWFLFFIKFAAVFFSSLARCWNLASYDISRFTIITTIFVKIETKSGTKLVRGKIPLRSLYVALFILLGVICMQATAAGHITITQFISGFYLS